MNSGRSDLIDQLTHDLSRYIVNRDLYFRLHRQVIFNCRNRIEGVGVILLQGKAAGQLLTHTGDSQHCSIDVHHDIVNIPAVAVSGAVDEDHRQLAILEDEVSRTDVLVARLLKEVSEDVRRQTNYVATERANLNTVSAAIRTAAGPLRLPIRHCSIHKRPDWMVNSMSSMSR